MPERYFFEIEGTPVAKPRMTQRDRWSPSKASVRYWAWCEEFKLRVVLSMREQGLQAPIAEPVSITPLFYIPVPRSVSKVERARRERVRHIIKPDLKNLVAALEDSLNKVLWQDDSLIYGYDRAAKLWTKEPIGMIQLEVLAG